MSEIKLDHGHFTIELSCRKDVIEKLLKCIHLILTKPVQCDPKELEDVISKQKKVALATVTVILYFEFYLNLISKFNIIF